MKQKKGFVWANLDVINKGFEWANLDVHVNHRRRDEKEMVWIGVVSKY